MQKEKLLKIGLIIVVFLLSVYLLSILLSEKKEEFNLSEQDIKMNSDEDINKIILEFEKSMKKSQTS